MPPFGAQNMDSILHFLSFRRLFLLQRCLILLLFKKKNNVEVKQWQQMRFLCNSCVTLTSPEF